MAALAAYGNAFSLSTGTAAWVVSQIQQLPVGNSTNTGGALNVISSAVVLTGSIPTSLPGFPQFQWQAPPPGSAWVGQLATDGVNVAGQGAAPGVYQYTLTFAQNLGGNFDLSYTADNSFVSVTITGLSSSFSAPAACGAFQPGCFNSTGNLVYAAGGANVVITAIVRNDPFPGVTDTARNPSGFLASGLGSTNNPITEPATCGMVALGAAALVAARRLGRSQETVSGR